MSLRKNPFIPLAVIFLLSACASIPAGPEILALPGTNKSLEEFRSDDAWCRNYAVEQFGGKTPSQAANESSIRSAVAGSALGGSAGSDTSDISAEGKQKRYDFLYVQCMYSKGHRIPVLGRPVRY